jgi:hypothetical protein
LERFFDFFLKLFFCVQIVLVNIACEIEDWYKRH